MPPTNVIMERINQISGIQLLFFIPGVFFLIIGIRTWVTQNTIVAGNNSMQGWNRPRVVTGRNTLFWAKLDLVIGVFLLIMCLLIALSVF